MKTLTIFTIRVLRLLLIILIVTLGAHTVSTKKDITKDDPNAHYYVELDYLPNGDKEWVVINLYGEQDLQREENTQEITALLTSE